MQLLFLALIGYLGWNTVKLLVPTLHKAEHFGLSFLIGMGIYSIVYHLLVLYLKFLPIDSHLIILLSLSFLSGLLVRVSKSKIIYFGASKKKLSWLELGFITVSGLVLLYIAVQNWYWPPYISDAVYLYDFRAQRLLDNDVNGFFNGIKSAMSKNYPPFTSLIHFFYYAFGFVNPKNAYTLLLGSFLVTLFGYVERTTGSRLRGIIAATLTLITPSVWWNSILALTNIPLMEYFSLAVLYLCDYKNEKNTRSSWLLAGFLLGMTSFIRQEAFWIPILSIAFLLAIYTKKILQFVLLAVICIFIANIWPASISWTTPAGHIQQESAAVLKIVSNITPTEIEYATIAIHGLWKSWGILVVIFYTLIIFQSIYVKRIKLSLVQGVGILMSASLILGFMAFAERFKGWAGLEDSVYRMGTLLVPIFWVGIITSPLWKKISRN